MRRAAHQDTPHKVIVSALKAVGASVYRIMAPEAGMPDLIVGYRRRTFLMEVKSPGKKPSDEQLKWYLDWRGHPVDVVHTPEEALAVLGITTTEEP